MNDSRRRLLGRYSHVGFTIPASHILVLLLVVLGGLPTAAVFADGLTRPMIPSQSFSTGFTASPSAPPRNPLRVQIGSSITLLDEAGRLARPVNPAEVVSWRQQIQSASHGTEGRALAHLHIGEWELAQNQQPETARWHFEQAQKLTALDSTVRGLCAYDLSVALFSRVLTRRLPTHSIICCLPAPNCPAMTGETVPSGSVILRPVPGIMRITQN